MLIGSGDQSRASSSLKENRALSIQVRDGGEPVVAIVSLRTQRITVYDANGWILRAPVSSGRKGRETPAGIFSVIQKNAEHYSNLYDDAYMPHMQRITWSGIALHGGDLPGYPASHGCIRLPFGFAARLFDLTRMGMRVIVAPGDVEPVGISHPALFTANVTGASAASKAAESEEATKIANHARLGAVMASREAARARMTLRAAETLKRRAEAQLAAAEIAAGNAESDEAREQAEQSKIQAKASITGLHARWVAASAELQPKLDAVGPAREAAVAAEAARAAAVEAAGDLESISVFISRKTQRLYVRRAFQPILETSVTILDADRPIGTHVFTAIARTSSPDLRWTVISLAEPQGQTPEKRGRDARVDTNEPREATSALDRIVIPPDALDRIGSLISPRSSLIISDEALSSETSKDTDFVVILSGEPQGSLKIRPRRIRPQAFSN